MNLDDAMKAHGDWKIKFRHAITNKELMEPSIIARDNCCHLGRWLYGEAKTKFGALPEYVELIQKHQHFHQEAAKVAELINAGLYADAEQALHDESTYCVASKSVGMAIFRLKRIIA